MTSLNPTITRWQGIGLVTTTLLGTGVFILPQLTVHLAGSLASVTWILLTLAILPLALVFAELGRRFLSAAGPAFFVQQAFGQRAGKVIGLLFLCIIPVGVPAALMMTFEFFKPLIQLTPWQTLMGQLAVLLLLFVLNWRGLHVSGRAQLGLTLVIVVVITVLLIAFAWQQPAPQAPIPSGSSLGMLQAMGLALWSFLGIEAVTHLATEFKNPEQDFVPAMLGGTVLVGLIYLACTQLSMLDLQAPLAIVGAYKILLHSDIGRWVIGLLGVISGLATVNVYMASLARLAWSLSQEGVLPKVFQPLNRHCVPSIALSIILSIASLSLMLAYTLGENFTALLLWANGVFILVYVVSMLAAWHLLDAKYRPAVVLALLVCAGFAGSLGWALGYGVLLAGLITGWVIFTAKAKLASTG